MDSGDSGQWTVDGGRSELRTRGDAAELQTEQNSGGSVHQVWVSPDGFAVGDEQASGIICQLVWCSSKRQG